VAGVGALGGGNVSKIRKAITGLYMDKSEYFSISNDLEM
jgi:hypothetical protein